MSKNQVEFSITNEERQSDFDLALKVCRSPLEAQMKIIGEFTETTAEGAIKLPQGDPEKAVGKAFREGPVRIVGKIQVDLVDVYSKLRKTTLGELKKWVNKHRESVPEFFFTTSAGQQHQSNTKDIAETIVAANDSAAEGEDTKYPHVVYDLARTSIEYGILVDQANEAINDVVKAVKSWRYTKRSPFAIGDATYNPSSWYQLQTKTRVEINRFAAQ